MNDDTLVLAFSLVYRHGREAHVGAHSGDLRLYRQGVTDFGRRNV